MLFPFPCFSRPPPDNGSAKHRFVRSTHCHYPPILYATFIGLLSGYYRVVIGLLSGYSARDKQGIRNPYALQPSIPRYAPLHITHCALRIERSLPPTPGTPRLFAAAFAPHIVSVCCTHHISPLSTSAHLSAVSVSVPRTYLPK